MNETSVFRQQLLDRKNRIGGVLRRGPAPGLLQLTLMHLKRSA